MLCNPTITRRLPILATLLSLTGCGPGGMSGDELTAALERYCVECHNPVDLAGELDLEALDAAHVDSAPEVWEAVVRKLRSGAMPPLDAPVRPESDTYDDLIASLERQLDATATLDPGLPVLRRLNRAEYRNSIRDLLGLDIDVAESLPPDDAAFGFDNIGDLLGVPPALLERYLAAADRVSALAVGDPEAPLSSKTWILPGDQSQTHHGEGLPLGTVGGLAVTYNFPLDAEYEFSVELVRNNLEGIRGLHHSHQVEFAVDGERILLESIGEGHEPEMPQGTIVTDRSNATDARLRVRAPVSAGEHTVTATFIRKIGAGTERLRPFDRSNADTYASDGRPHIESMTVAGPFDPTGAGSTASRARIFTCRPDNTQDADDGGPLARPLSRMDESACAREILGRLARTAYRRPVDDADLAWLMPFFDEGRARGSFETGIQFALRRILASPSFVFRVEQVPPGLAPGEAYAVSDLELATRLSFFIWSSLPDEALIDLAVAGRLGEPDVLASEVRRMLADPRASALAENFAAQWLHLRNLDTIRPNTDFYPDFDNNLRQGFKREAELFFMSIVRENRSLIELLTADYTFVDERLARHYGIPGIYGSQFRRVSLDAERTTSSASDGEAFAAALDARRGLLGKGGVLMATSHADRTAPSLRGKWLLENLLGSPPPAPPADVPDLEVVAAIAPKTMRERLETHREMPACAGCHSLIDPLGFALENFDAVGGWRVTDAGRAVDAQGALADGTPINGVTELRDALVAEPEAFASTVTEKLMIYALGRGLRHYDMPTVRAILRDAESDDYRFADIVQGIVASPAFRMRSESAAD